MLMNKKFTELCQCFCVICAAYCSVTKGNSDQIIVFKVVSEPSPILHWLNKYSLAVKITTLVEPMLLNSDLSLCWSAVLSI